MSQQRANGRQAKASTYSLSGKAMPKVVDPKSGDPRRLAYLRPIPFESGAVSARTGTREDVLRRPVVLADLSEQLPRWRAQRNFMVGLLLRG
jgi:hypothetical protein